MTNLLVVCTANICRSPMGEALLRNKIADAGLQGEWNVRSAGTWAVAAAAASEFSVAEMGDRGLDIRNHRSQPVTRALLEQTDLVLVMTKNQREMLRAEFPDQADRVFLFSALGGLEFDIVDPVGQPRQEYAACACELETLVEEGFGWLEGEVRRLREARRIA